MIISYNIIYIWVNPITLFVTDATDTYYNDIDFIISCVKLTAYNESFLFIKMNM